LVSSVFEESLNHVPFKKLKNYLNFFLWRSRFKRFLRLCVAIFLLLRFFPLGTVLHLLNNDVQFYSYSYGAKKLIMILFVFDN